jgi:hypothetical protein
MPEPRCGAPTRSGTACGWLLERCPHAAHREHREGRPPRRARGNTTPADASTGPIDARRQPWYEGRDLRLLGWWVIDTVLDERLDMRRATVLVAVMRVLAALGMEPLAREQVLREVELLGSIMNGIPPRDPSQWEQAVKLFDAGALEEISRWEALITEEMGPGSAN